MNGCQPGFPVFPDLMPMKASGDQLQTPIYLKLNDQTPWPHGESVFHLLGRDGVFRCRNHAFFRSCVPAPSFPRELAPIVPSLQLSYPRLPQPLIETIVGFFDIIAERSGSEAAVLLVWNQATECIEPWVPPQSGTVMESWQGSPFPIDLQYEIPPLPPGYLLIGDVHSHVDGPAFASQTDRADEVHQPGLHLVVGRIRNEPPQFHCDVMVDGTRFQVRDLSLVLEGYGKRRRNAVPDGWLDCVSTKPWSNDAVRVQWNSSPSPAKSVLPECIATARELRP
jgi:hypothetical protein